MTWLFAPWHCAPGSVRSNEASDAASPTCALWALSSGKPTLRPSSWREWRKRPWWRVLTGATRSGTTSARSMDGRGGIAWISSSLATRVSPSLVRARAAAISTSGGSGARSGASFARWDPATCSWRTSQATFLGRSDAYSETWPRAGGVSNGTAFLRPPSAPLTSVTACSCLLPTPTASPYLGSTQNGSNADRPSAGTLSLMSLARKDLLPTPTTRANQEGKHGTGTLLDHTQRLLPTPTAMDMKGSGNVASRRTGSTRGPSLTDAVRRLPTPTAMDMKGPSGRKGHGGRSLGRAMIPTPTAADARRSSDATIREGSPSLTGFLVPTPMTTNRKLHVAAARLPTPTTNPQAPNTSSNQVNGPTSLLEAAKLLPTPTSRDCRSGGASTETLESNSRPLNEIVAGGNPRLRLSPRFVEWMMGLPEDYTAIPTRLFARPPNLIVTGPIASTRSATPSSSRPRRARSRSCGTASTNGASE